MKTSKKELKMLCMNYIILIKRRYNNMKERQVNNELMNRIGFSKPEEIDELRKEYNKIIKIIRNEEDEKDFYYSVLCWWNDGNAPYYNTYLQREWK